MSREETILNKIQVLIANQFKTTERAYEFFDDDSDEELTTREIVQLLKGA